MVHRKIADVLFVKERQKKTDGQMSFPTNVRMVRTNMMDVRKDIELESIRYGNESRTFQRRE